MLALVWWQMLEHGCCAMEEIKSRRRSWLRDSNQKWQVFRRTITDVELCRRRNSYQHFVHEIQRVLARLYAALVQAIGAVSKDLQVMLASSLQSNVTECITNMLLDLIGLSLLWRTLLPFSVCGLYQNHCTGTKAQAREPCCSEVY